MIEMSADVVVSDVPPSALIEDFPHVAGRDLVSD
jgi:hypothetical protein